MGKKEKFISRVVTKSSSGWQLRIPFVKTLFFSESKYGSIEGALKEAISKRDNIIDKDKSLQLIGHKKKSTKNTSGVTGVCFQERTKSWVAYWSKNNKQHITRFSIIKYGDEIAKTKAINFRNEKIKDN